MCTGRENDTVSSKLCQLVKKILGIKQLHAHLQNVCNKCAKYSTGPSFRIIDNPKDLDLSYKMDLDFLDVL